MDSVYEKVCPACGRSATLAAKFCSGCGHQYRTIFQDQARQDDDGDGGWDLRWAPVLAVTPVLIVVLILMMGRQNAPAPVETSSTTITESAPESTPDLGAFATAAATVTPGEDERRVLLQFGTPQRVIPTTIAGVKTQAWYYVRNGRTLEIDFDSTNKVSTYMTY